MWTIRLAVVVSLQISLMAACGGTNGGIERGASRAPNDPALRPDQSAIPGQSVPQRDTDFANRQFRVLDPGFDFNPKDNIPVAQLAARFPVRSGGRSQVAWLNDGRDFFAARIRLLRSARKSVRIQSLIFENDESSRVIANELIDLVNRGVQVKVIVDPVVNYSLQDQELYFQLQRNGVMIEGYEVLYLNYLGKALNFSDLGLTVGDANMRYHEKLFIVDGELPTGTAIIGGVNLGNNYFRVDRENPKEMWRDRDALVRGEIVSDMVRAFELVYTEFSLKRRNGLLGDTNTYWGWTNALFGKKGKIEMDGMRPEILNRLNALADRPFNPQFMPADIRFVQSRPRMKEDLIMPAFIDMINRSEQEILINNSYFLPDEEFKGALKAAIKRGVRVKVITNHVENTDLSQLHLLARTEYKDFLQFNVFGNGEELVEIYEWAGDPVLNNGEGLNHSKYAVFDRKAVMMGSFNIDPRSRKLNSESVIFMEDPAVAKTYRDEFFSEIQPQFAQKVLFFQAQSFQAPEGLRERLELRISEILRPLL